MYYLKSLVETGQGNVFTKSGRGLIDIDLHPIGCVPKLIMRCLEREAQSVPQGIVS